MIHQVRHTTTYTYQAEVLVSHHLARLQPRPHPVQVLLDHRLEIEPSPAVRREQVDYFGNPLAFFTVQEVHHQLRVTAHSRVEVHPGPPPDPGASTAWQEVARLSYEHRLTRVGAAAEFAFDSPLVARHPDFAGYAAGCFAPGRPILEGAIDLMQRIHRDFEFDPAASSVSTPVAEIFRQRRGVCQDFAHLMIACLRSLGLPARYVSGYLETVPPPGEERLQGADASHAWLAVFCPRLGWIDLDPTNALVPSDRHITLAWGRDYSEVSPLRGVLVGSGQHQIDVAVDVLPERD